MFDMPENQTKFSLLCICIIYDDEKGRREKKKKNEG